MPKIRGMSTLVGVSQSKRNRVLSRLTVPGAFATAVPRYDADDARELQDAIVSVGTGLKRYASSGVDNAYHRAIGIDTYDLTLAPDTGFGGDWTDIVSSFVGEIGKGIGGKISGKNPYVTTVNQAPVAAPPPGMSAGVKVALAVGAGLLGVVVLAKVLR